MKFGLLIVGAIGVMVLLSQARTGVQQGQQIVERDNIGTTPLPTSHPLSIASYEEGRFGISEFRVERQTRQTNKFRSEVVSFVANGLKQYALMNTPLGTAPDEGWPVVVVNHGYIPPEVFSTENSYINTSAYFASAGFLVIKPDYRGHDNSEGSARTITDRIGYGHDVLSLVESIEQLPGANEKEVFLYGHSMGGDVSLRVAQMCGQCVRAVSLWAPAVTNYEQQVTYFRRNNQAEVEEIREQLKELTAKNAPEQFSTFDNLERIEVPITIHHGTNDISVPYSWGVELNEELNKLGKQTKLYTYTGDDHDISRNWGVALGRDVEWFRTMMN